MLASAKQGTSFHVLTSEFYLHVHNCIYCKDQCVFLQLFSAFQGTSSGFLVPLMFCMLFDKPTHCFVILAEVGVKILLKELPYGKQVLLSATLDH